MERKGRKDFDLPVSSNYHHPPCSRVICSLEFVGGEVCMLACYASMAQTLAHSSTPLGEHPGATEPRLDTARIEVILVACKRCRNEEAGKQETGDTAGNQY